MKRLVRLAAALLLLLGAHAHAIEVGQKAPDFALAGSDGKTYKLADLAGRSFVFAWFPKAFTAG